MSIKLSEFLVSNSDIEKCPKDKIPEYEPQTSAKTIQDNERETV